MAQKRRIDSGATIGAGGDADGHGFSPMRDCGSPAQKAGQRGKKLRGVPQVAANMRPDHAKMRAAGKTCDGRIDTIAAIAFSKVSSFIRVDDKGQPQLDLSRVSHRDLAGLSFLRISIQRAGSGLDQEIMISFHVKMLNKLGPLSWLLRYCVTRERGLMAKFQ
jgi:hypothetical protein